MIGEDIDGVMLHDAIGKNDAAMAGRLIEGLAPSALVSTNKAGCTPLMLLAMGQCGRADGLRLVRALLDRCAAAGAPTGAALRSHNKRTAAEYDALREGYVNHQVGHLLPVTGSLHLAKQATVQTQGVHAP